jgi:phenylacetate-coenzyme A ligase PaaK-like adenylate-forming protein
MAAITGEASTPELRSEIRALLRRLGTAGATIFDRYGSTETGGFAQCREAAEWHNPAPDQLYCEAVDPATGAALPEGTPGHLAITHLDRRGTVLIRYLLGDIGAVERSPCPHCGRTAERIIGPLARSGPLVKIKGMLVNPALLLAALQALPGIAEFAAEVTRPAATGMDELLVRVALHPCAAPEAAAAAVIAAAQAAIGVRPRVVIEAEPRAIYDADRQAKARRFIDRR